MDVKAIRTRYADLPGFGPGHILARLQAGDVPDGFPFYTQAHVSRSAYLDRRKLADVLQAGNTCYGNTLSDSQMESLRTNGRLVVTGQQPGLLTGPLYALWKAISTVIWARRLSRQTGIRHLPCFWMATEDHDVLEVNRVTVAGHTFVWDYPGPLRSGEVPEVGGISLLQCKKPLLAFLNRHLPQTEYTSQVMNMVAAADYSNYATLFASLLLGICRGYELLLLDPRHIRRLTAPVLADLAEHWHQVRQAFVEGTDMLMRAGYAPQVRSADIFEINKQGRRKCRHTAKGFQTTAGDLSRRELAEAIRARPEHFSPNAALRPVLQDAVLPVALYLGGPAEMLYQWQIDPLFAVLGVQRSKLHPRVSATLVEPAVRRALDKTGIPLEQLFDAVETLKTYQPDTGECPEALEVQRLAAPLVAHLDALQAGSGDPVIAKAAASIAYQAERAAKRLAVLRVQKTKGTRQHLERIVAGVYPGGKLQERVNNMFYYLAKYGMYFSGRIIECLTRDICHHAVVLGG